MSYTPQGPGWWQASDGRWYPPQAAPRSQAPYRAGPGKGRSVTAVAIGAVGLLAVIAIAVAAYVIGANEDDGNEPSRSAVRGPTQEIYGIDDTARTGDFE